MRVVLNILWLVLAGVWLAIGYCVAALVMAITIIGLPLAKQALNILCLTKYVPPGTAST